MPRARHYGILAFGTIDTEEHIGRMVIVGHTDRYDNVSCTDIQVLAKTLLHPELLKGHLSAAFNFLLKLARLLGFLFHSGLNATVLKLNLSPHRPSTTEIVS